MPADPEELTYYKIARSYVDDSGVVILRVSVWDEDVHSSCAGEIEQTHGDYLFWRWIIDHPEFQRTLNSQEFAAAKDRFALESGLS